MYAGVKGYWLLDTNILLIYKTTGPIHERVFKNNIIIFILNIGIDPNKFFISPDPTHASLDFTKDSIINIDFSSYGII